MSESDNVWKRLREAMELLTERVRQTQKTMKPLREAIEHAPEHYKKVQPYLADKGWHIVGDIPLTCVKHLSDLIDGREDQKVEAEMVAFARTQVASLLTDAEGNWPSRRPMIEHALEAHKQGQYALSIPLLLAQSDGICHDILHESLFTKNKNGHPKTQKGLKKYLESFTLGNTLIPLGSFSELLLTPLRMTSSINENTSVRASKRKHDPSYGPLNRHAVMHGLEHDYATEGNSLRAILLIKFLVDLKKTLHVQGALVSELRNFLGDDD